MWEFETKTTRRVSEARVTKYLVKRVISSEGLTSLMLGVATRNLQGKDQQTRNQRLGSSSYPLRRSSKSEVQIRECGEVTVGNIPLLLEWALFIGEVEQGYL